MLSMAAFCSDIGVFDRGTGRRASITISHTQPMTAELNVMLINTSTRDIRDQSLGEDGIMNRSDRLAKSGAGGIIANTQAIWVPADRRRFCNFMQGQCAQGLYPNSLEERFWLLSISYPDACSPDFICAGPLSHVFATGSLGSASPHKSQIDPARIPPGRFQIGRKAKFIHVFVTT
jgi:hypothetical protein